MRSSVTESILDSRLSALLESASDLVWFGGFFEKCPSLFLYDDTDIKRGRTIPIDGSNLWLA